MSEIKISANKFFQILMPILASIIATNIAVLVDRIVVGKVSSDLMNSVASGCSFMCIFLLFGLAIISCIENTSITACYSNNKELMCKSITNCIIFSILYFLVVLIICSFFCYLDGYSPKTVYALIVSPIIPISMVMCIIKTYFVSCNMKRIVIWLSIFLNISNFILDCFFVFVLNLDVIGVAFATVLANAAYLIFGWKIFSKRHGWVLNYDLKIAKKDILDGIPCAISVSLETVAWFVMFQILEVNSNYLSTYVMFNSAMLIMMFFSESISKTVMNLATGSDGNLTNLCHLKSITVKILLFFAVILFGWSLFFGQRCISLYQSFYNLQLAIDDYSIYAFSCFLLFDLVSYAMHGFLMAERDTKYLMVVNLFNIWLLGVIPMYLIIKLTLPISFITMPLLLYACSNAVCLYFRIVSKKGLYAK